MMTRDGSAPGAPVMTVMLGLVIDEVKAGYEPSFRQTGPLADAPAMAVAMFAPGLRIWLHCANEVWAASRRNTEPTRVIVVTRSPFTMKCVVPNKVKPGVCDNAKGRAERRCGGARHDGGSHDNLVVV
jgi:hypothetical protein